MLLEIFYLGLETIQLTDHKNIVGAFFVSIWHIMHFVMPVSILSWGLFIGGIPRTSIIKIASNKIPIDYLVMQDFQQIRYSFSTKLHLQFDILETHNTSMCLKNMLILTNDNPN